MVGHCLCSNRCRSTEDYDSTTVLERAEMVSVTCGRWSRTGVGGRDATGQVSVMVSLSSSWIMIVLWSNDGNCRAHTHENMERD